MSDGILTGWEGDLSPPVHAEFFATANVRSPFVVIFDRNAWNPNSGVVRAARGGVRLLTREGCAAERELCDGALTQLAIGWGSAQRMVCQVACMAGIAEARRLMAAVRANRDAIKRLEAKRTAKFNAKQRQKNKQLAIVSANEAERRARAAGFSSTPNQRSEA